MLFLYISDCLEFLVTYSPSSMNHQFFKPNSKRSMQRVLYCQILIMINVFYNFVCVCVFINVFYVFLSVFMYFMR